MRTCLFAYVRVRVPGTLVLFIIFGRVTIVISNFSTVNFALVNLLSRLSQGCIIVVTVSLQFCYNLGNRITDCLSYIHDTHLYACTCMCTYTIHVALQGIPICFGKGQDDQPWCSIHTGDGQLSLYYGLVKGRMISHGAVYIQGMVGYPYVMVR